MKIAKKSISSFLDEMVSKLENFTSSQMQELRLAFEKAMQRNYLIFVDTAFAKPSDENNSKRKRKNSTLFEVLTTTMAELSDQDFSTLLRLKDTFLDEYNKMLREDNDFVRSITYSTQKKEHYRIRKAKVKSLIQKVINSSFLTIF